MRISQGRAFIYIQRRVSHRQIVIYWCVKLLGISYRDHIANEEVKVRIANAIRPHEDLLTSETDRQKRERERDRERETDRQTETERDTQRERDRQTDRQTDRERERQRQRERER